MTEILEEEYRKRLQAVADIFAEAVQKAQEVSRGRCPYRNRFDKCTAAFRCRNQQKMEVGDQLCRCGHDGVFDYRLAWETDTSIHARARRKIQEIRTQAQLARSPDLKSGS